MIKLIGSDIDGTLVSEGAHRIDPQYYEVIRELKELGIRFCACSGRQYPSMRELFAPVADDIYFISNSGTLIRTTERELFSWSIKPEICMPLIRKIKSIEGMNLIVGLSDVTLIDADEGSEFLHFVRDEYHYTIRKVEDLSAIDPEGVIEVSMYCDNVQSVAEKLKKDPAFSDLLWSVSGERWCDITAKEAGKGEAFALLQEYLGIGQEETVYFGDNLNDLPAFREAGVAVTVANARSEMQEEADIVGESYSDLGVLRQLQNIVRHARDYRNAFPEES